MTRPKHSQGGFLRYMQMSQIPLFAIMEGHKTDRYFYGRLCHISCESTGLKYQVITAAELQGEGGGKSVVLSYFDYLRKRGTLISELKGKATGTVFFVDKDIDDLLRRQRRNPHIIYTRSYDVEGDIVSIGDIARAAAATACLDELEVKAQIGDATAWKRECANKWKQWIILCIFCKKHSIKDSPNFRLISQVNSPGNGLLDPKKLSQKLADVQSNSGMAPDLFSREYISIERSVNRIFAADKHDKVFKGKWYIYFINEEIARIAVGRSINQQALHAGFMGTLGALLDYRSQWSDYYTNPIKSIVDATVKKVAPDG